MNNFKSKLTMIFLILAVGVMAAYFVISSVSPKSAVVGNDLKNEGGDSSGLQDNSGNLFAQNGGDSNLFGDKLSAGNNLTENFGNSFFNQVEASVAAGKNPNDLKNAAGLMSGNILSDLSKEIPKFKTAGDIADVDLKILSGVSGSEADSENEIYWQNIKSAVEKYSNDLDPDFISGAIGSVYGKLDVSGAVKLAGVYKNLTADFMDISVPKNLVFLHKKIIAYYKNAEIVYSAMSEYPKDPIKGYMALEMIDELDVEAQEIGNNIEKYRK